MNSKYALISVSNKDNLEMLVLSLVKYDYKIIATTSTAKSINEMGVDAITIEEIASFSEMLDGRVKTLQPEIQAGILADLDKSSHLDDLKKYNINPTSLVVCNLYPFESTLESIDEDKLFDEESKKKLIENIDIGGITLIRASAKNHKHVSLLCDPVDYIEFVQRLEENDISLSYRETLAQKGFITSYSYDLLIANYFMKLNSNNSLLINAELKQQLRYGENPHQDGYYYESNKTSYSLASSKILQGKTLSYNNILDIDAAFKSIYDFDMNTVVSLKHNTICGIGFDDDLYNAFLKCFETDSISIFGGIVIFNGEVNEKIALKLNEIFLEIVIAESFTKEALNVFSNKSKLIVIEGNFSKSDEPISEIRSINDGYLKQITKKEVLEYNVVTDCKSQEFKSELTNLYCVVKNVKSNAIVIGQDDIVLGISGGMVSRIDACDFALQKALKNKCYDKDKPLLLASDGFFPFNDIIDLALEHNIKYIIQPGGSINDKKLIAGCNDHGITLIFTGIRYFRH